MTKLTAVTDFLDDLLKIKDFADDPSNNGLQCEGRPEVKKVVFGVDARAALFQAAAKAKADLVVVHHGLSWRHGFQRLTGVDAERFRLLLSNGLSLYAAHLPLDAHPRYGNNAILAEMLDLKARKPFFRYAGYAIGVAGQLHAATPVETLAEILADRLNADYTIFGEAARPVRRIGVVSGGGGDAVPEAVKAGLDVLVTGEVTHAECALIQELALPVIALGHYKSETVGVQRLMSLLEAKFGIKGEFVDLPTGL